MTEPVPHERGDPGVRALPRPRPPVLESARTRVAEAVRFHPREAAAIAVLVVLLLGGAAIAYARARPVGVPPLAAAPGATAAGEPAQGAKIFVHVVGAVRRPGVFELTDGARVVDAIRAAGGLRKRADSSAVNLARALTDGEQIVVPERGEAAGARGGAAGPRGTDPAGKVNINVADVTQLDSLPGIGPVLAERIVAYREQHGPFGSVRDLLKVSGIGVKKFESLETSVTV